MGETTNIPSLTILGLEGEVRVSPEPGAQHGGEKPSSPPPTPCGSRCPLPTSPASHPVPVSSVSPNPGRLGVLWPSSQSSWVIFSFLL